LIRGNTHVIDVHASHLPGACREVGSILARVGDKWTVLVVMMLAKGPHRFSELKRAIGGVSQRMLTLTLRGLERDGLVRRTWAELGAETPVLATGGLAERMGSLCDTISDVDMDLTLTGLRMIHEKNRA